HARFGGPKTTVKASMETINIRRCRDGNQERVKGNGGPARIASSYRTRNDVIAAGTEPAAGDPRRIDAEVRSLSCHPAHGRVRIFHRTRELRFGREPVADRDDHAATVVREGPARSVGATKTPDHPTPAVEVHQRGCGRLRRPVDADGERAAGTG